MFTASDAIKPHVIERLLKQLGNVHRSESCEIECILPDRTAQEP